MDDIRIAVIGGGAMGGAAVRGLVEAGVKAGLITVSNPTAGKLRPACGSRSKHPL